MVAFGVGFEQGVEKLDEVGLQDVGTLENVVAVEVDALVGVLVVLEADVDYAVIVAVEAD